MRRASRASLLLFLSVLGLAAATPVWSIGDDEARPAFDILIERMQGTVDVTSNGDARRAEVGATLELPSRIVTGNDGGILLRQGRTGVDIAPDSDVEIPEAAADGQLIARMIQHRGSAFYDVETRPLEQLKLTVETPNLVAVVKGTQFNIAVVGDTTTISLFEGRLEVRSPDGRQSIQLNAGEIAIRSLTDQQIRMLPMDADRLDEAARLDTTAGSGEVAQSTASLARPDGGVTVDGALGVEAGTGGAAGGATVARLDNKVAVGGVDGDADTRVDLGDGSADLGLNTGIATRVDLGTGSVDLALDTGLDTGIELGDGGVDLELDSSLDTGIELGGASLDTDVDLALDTDLDSGIHLDTAIDTDLGLGAELGLDLGLGLDPDSDLDLGLDLNLGLADSGATDTGSTGGSGGSGGVLGGLGDLLGL